MAGNLAALMALQRQKARPSYAVEVGAPRVEQPALNPAAVAALQSNDDHIAASIASKLTRAPVMGVVPNNSGLIPMAQLAHLNLPASPNEQGIPYGLDPRNLNSLEMKWLTRRR